MFKVMNKTTGLNYTVYSVDTTGVNIWFLIFDYDTGKWLNVLASQYVPITE